MWRYRVPTVRAIGQPDATDDAETASLAKFADADEDALPLDRPHAPNCVRLRRFLRNESTEERYADLSFSNGDDGSITTSRLGGEHDKDVTRRSRALQTLLKGCRKPKSSALQTDSCCGLDIDKATVGWENFQRPEQLGGFGCRGEDQSQKSGVVRRKTNNSHRKSVSSGHEVVARTCATPEPSPSSTKKNEVVEGRVIPPHNLFVRAYNFIRLMLAALCQVLKDSLKVPFRVGHVDGRNIPKVSANSNNLRPNGKSANIENSPCSTKRLNERYSDESEIELSKSVQEEHVLECKNSKSSEIPMDEARCNTTMTVDAGSVLDRTRTKSIERHLDEAHFDLTTTVHVGNVPGRMEFKSRQLQSGVRSDVELGGGIERKEPSSSSGSRIMLRGTVVEIGMERERKTGHSTETPSKAVCNDVRDGKQVSFEEVSRYLSDREVEDPHAKKQERAALHKSTLNPESLSAGTEEEDGDAWLWHEISNSDKWMDESERTLHQATLMKVEESPLGCETSRQLPCGTRHIRMDSSNEYSFYSPEPEARKTLEKRRSESFVANVVDEKEPLLSVDEENLVEQRQTHRKASTKSSETPVCVFELHHRRSIEEGTRRLIIPRMTSANYEPQFLAESDDPSNTQRRQHFDQDQYMSSCPNTPIGSSQAPKRKASIRSGIKNDVKAVTESVKRVLMRNKPEPDTRFTSPRSAPKTLTIIADVMVKEFECMVAVRRTGAFKIRSEKVYSTDARLRTTLRFRALDAFSCHVIICRSRDDDFTVPTADYVNFVAGLQQKFLNSVTGAWRYQ